jgi:hypothetical protein
MLDLCQLVIDAVLTAAHFEHVCHVSGRRAIRITRGKVN